MRSCFQGSQPIRMLVKLSHYPNADASLPHLPQAKQESSRTSRKKNRNAPAPSSREVQERTRRHGRKCGRMAAESAGGAGALLGSQAPAGSSYFGKTGTGAGSSVPAA